MNNSIGLRALLVCAVVFGLATGVVFAADLHDVLFGAHTGYTAEFANGEEAGDEMPTMTVDVGPEQNSEHLCDFFVQGHSGVQDISSATVEVTDAADQTQAFVATYANGGLVTTPEGTRATLAGIVVPSDYKKVRLSYIYSDGKCYDFAVGEGLPD